MCNKCQSPKKCPCPCRVTAKAPRLSARKLGYRLCYAEECGHYVAAVTPGAKGR